jgi:hypothetical protein
MFAPGGDGLVLRTLLVPQRCFADEAEQLRSLGRTLRESVRQLAPRVCSAPAAIAILVPGRKHGGTVEIAGPTGDAMIMPFDRSYANVDIACYPVPRDETNVGALFGWVWAPDRGSLNLTVGAHDADPHGRALTGSPSVAVEMPCMIPLHARGARGTMPWKL